jgi:hypothetical protein
VASDGSGELAGGGDSRRKVGFAGSFGAARVWAGVRVVPIMGVIAAIGFVLIWAGDRSGSANGSGATPRATSGYDALLALLPATVRSTCRPKSAGSGSGVSAAECSVGEFALWSNRNAMESELNTSGATTHSCADAPPGTTRYTTALPSGGRAGSVICEQIDSGRRYCIEWGVNDLLLTGSFYSTEDSGTGGYRPAYDVAMSTLAQLP